MTPEASSDVETIFDYIARDSPQNAATVAAVLIAAVDSLSQFPHRYKVHRSSRDPNRVIRSMPVPPYVVYYRSNEDDGTVHVLTIRHGSRRQPGSL